MIRLSKVFRVEIILAAGTQMLVIFAYYIVQGDEEILDVNSQHC